MRVDIIKSLILIQTHLLSFTLSFITTVFTCLFSLIIMSGGGRSVSLEVERRLELERLKLKQRTFFAKNDKNKNTTLEYKYVNNMYPFVNIFNCLF